MGSSDERHSEAVEQAEETGRMYSPAAEELARTYGVCPMCGSNDQMFRRNRYWKGEFLGVCNDAWHPRGAGSPGTDIGIFICPVCEAVIEGDKPCPRRGLKQHGHSDRRPER